MYQYNPFAQAPYQMQRPDYTQGLQFQPAFQNLSPELQQQSALRHQQALDQMMHQRQLDSQQYMQQFQNNPFARMMEDQRSAVFGNPNMNADERAWAMQASRADQGMIDPAMGLQLERQEFERQIADGRDMMAEREEYLSNIPEAQRAQAERQFNDHYARVGWNPPQQPQQPPVQDGFTTLVEAARRRQGIPEPQQPDLGPQQPNPQFGAQPRQGVGTPGPWGAGGPSQMLRGPSGGNPMHPQSRQPAQHWTPPSVNMPMHQRNQPWMGGQSQLAAQYGGQSFGAQREYQGNPFAQQGRRGGSTNPFQSRRGMNEPVLRAQPFRPEQPPSGGQSRLGGNGGYSIEPTGEGFSPSPQTFNRDALNDRRNQQRQQMQTNAIR